MQTTRVPVLAGVLAVLLAVGAWAAARWLAAGRALPAMPSSDLLGGKGSAMFEQVQAAHASARQHPRSGERIGALGQVYHANLFYAEAERCYERASQLDPSDYRWPYYRVVLGETRGAHEDALGLLRQVLSLRPEFVPAWLRMANALFKLDRLAEAEAAYGEALAYAPGNPHANFGVARIAMSRGELASAATRLEDLVAEHPGFGSACRLLAEVYAAMGRGTDAEAQVRLAKGRPALPPLDDPLLDALQAISTSVTFLLKEAELADRSGDRERRRRLLERAIQIAPEDADVHFALATYFTEHNRIADAARHYRETVRLRPSYAEAHRCLAGMLEAQRHRDEAVKHAREAVRLEPHKALYQHDLGLLLAQLARPEEALERLQEAIRLAPSVAQFHNNLGVVLSQWDRPAEALESFQRARELAPPSPTLLHNMGTTLGQLGRLDEALDCLRQARSLDSTIPAVYVDLGDVLTRRGETAEAIRTLREGMQACPGHPAPMAAFARLLATCPDANLRNAAEAARLAERAIQITGQNDPEAMNALATVLAETVPLDQALSVARRALQLAQDRGLLAVAHRIEANIKRLESRRRQDH